MQSAAPIVRRIFSGIQPTGVPHLGNYFGAISRWVDLLDDKPIFSNNLEFVCDKNTPPCFCIVDIHSYSSKNFKFGKGLNENILNTAASLIALGLDPDKCVLFRQSDVLEHTYLACAFQNFVTLQRLSHMTQYKDRSRSLGKNKPIPSALLNYPVLQAADILLYHGNLVPVGEDQLQHIELCRDIARKFNIETESNYFQDPHALLDNSPHARRIKSLRDPTVKMSKSDASKRAFIEVIDEPDVIFEKCKKALTDLDQTVYYDDLRPGISNLLRLYQLTTSKTTEEVEKEFKGREALDLKSALAEALIEKFRNVRENYKILRADSNEIENVLKSGASKARNIAHQTTTEVRQLLGSIN